MSILLVVFTAVLVIAFLYLIVFAIPCHRYQKSEGNVFESLFYPLCGLIMAHIVGQTLLLATTLL
jgi:heme/copper-type cytochrome/quinol oxidase subunit 3